MKKRTVHRITHMYTTGEAARTTTVSLPCEPWETPDEQGPDNAGKSKKKTADEAEDRRRGPRHLGHYRRDRKTN